MHVFLESDVPYRMTVGGGCEQWFVVGGQLQQVEFFVGFEGCRITSLH
jgi:hypothetical protein